MAVVSVAVEAVLAFGSTKHKPNATIVRTAVIAATPGPASKLKALESCFVLTVPSAPAICSPFFRDTPPCLQEEMEVKSAAPCLTASTPNGSILHDGSLLMA